MTVIKPNIGDQNWGGTLNAALDSLDTGKLDAATASVTYVAVNEAPLNPDRYKNQSDPDDVNCLTAAIAALPAAGGRIHLGRMFTVATPITVGTPCVIEGRGQGTGVKTSSVNNTTFNITGQRIKIRDCQFATTATRTGGYYLDITSAASLVDVQNCFLDFGVGVIRSAGNLVTMDNLRFASQASGSGVGITVTGGGTGVINNVIFQESPNIFACIVVNACGDLRITNSELLGAGIGLQLAPGAGQQVASVKVSGTFLDHCGRGAYLTAVGAGASIVRAEFDGCDFTSSTNQGVLMSTGSSGVIDGVRFTGCNNWLNTDGYNIADTGVTNVHVEGGVLAGNSSAGLDVSAGVSGFSMKNAKVGPFGAIGANLYPYYIATGASDDYMIVGNDLRGNTNAGVDGGSGTHKLIANNLT